MTKTIHIFGLASLGLCFLSAVSCQKKNTEQKAEFLTIAPASTSYAAPKAAQFGKYESQDRLLELDFWVKPYFKEFVTSVSFPLENGSLKTINILLSAEETRAIFVRDTDAKLEIKGLDVEKITIESSLTRLVSANPNDKRAGTFRVVRLSYDEKLASGLSLKMDTKLMFDTQGLITQIKIKSEREKAFSLPFTSKFSVVFKAEQNLKLAQQGALVNEYPHTCRIKYTDVLLSRLESEKTAPEDFKSLCGAQSAYVHE